MLADVMTGLQAAHAAQVAEAVADTGDQDSNAETL